MGRPYSNSCCLVPKDITSIVVDAHLIQNLVFYKFKTVKFLCSSKQINDGKQYNSLTIFGVLYQQPDKGDLPGRPFFLKKNPYARLLRVDAGVIQVVLSSCLMMMMTEIQQNGSGER